MKNFNNYSPKKMVQRIFNSAHQRKWQISEIIIFFAQLGELKKFACAERKLVCIWFQLLFSLSRSFWNDLWHFSWHLRLITFFFFYSFLFLFLIIIFAAHDVLLSFFCGSLDGIFDLRRLFFLTFGVMCFLWRIYGLRNQIRLLTKQCLDIRNSL